MQVKFFCLVVTAICTLAVDGIILSRSKVPFLKTPTSLSRRYSEPPTAVVDGAIAAAPLNLQSNLSLTPFDSKIGLLPCGDALDRRIFTLFIPAVLNYILIPLTGAVDCFWVGKMGDALALAGQSAGNQMFASAFFLSSFLPAVVSPLIAAAKSKLEVQERCHQAMWIALIVGTIATLILALSPRRVLSTVLPAASPALKYALPYLNIRSFTLLPSILSTVAFAVFRGNLNIVTPLRIAFISNIINIILDPILIFSLKMGVSGAAAATCIADLASFGMYFYELSKLKLFHFTKFRQTLPSWTQLKPLLAGGLSIQIRALAIEFAFLAVSRATQTDSTGFKGAAHAVTVQLWQLGSVVLLAMATVGSTLVPVEVVRLKRLEGEDEDEYDLTRARRMANRIMSWGVTLGIILSVCQLCALPAVSAFSNIPEVQKAARMPVIISAGLQLMNGVVFTGEGIQQGNQYFSHLAFSTILASMAMLLFLRQFGQSLVGVWCSLIVLYGLRLVAVMMHHFFLGPLATQNLKVRRKVPSTLKI